MENKSARAEKCPMCPRPLPRSTARGRPKDFCGPLCRKAASLELGRVSRRLEVLEWRRTSSTITNPALFHNADDPKAIDAEIRRERRRLNEILAGRE